MRRILLALGCVAMAVVTATFAAQLQHPEDEVLIDEAIAALKGSAYHADRVDWPGARARALERVTSEGTLEGVRSLVRELRDGHSFVIDAKARGALGDPSRHGDFGIVRARHGALAYLSVPSFVGTHPDRMGAFVGELRKDIDELGREGTCGWLVDLRGNTGGNMYPMLAGLRPLLGPSEFGYFAARDGVQPWNVSKFEASLGTLPGASQADLGRAVVAVLIGPETQSSGEAVAVAFKGRPRTRFFGQMTGGKSSGNRGITLSDGSMMLVLTALFADRAGHVYGGPLEPDEWIGARLDPPDRVVEAARRWLLENPACATQGGAKQIK